MLDNPEWSPDIESCPRGLPFFYYDGFVEVRETDVERTTRVIEQDDVSPDRQIILNHDTLIRTTRVDDVHHLPVHISGDRKALV